MADRPTNAETIPSERSNAKRSEDEPRPENRILGRMDSREGAAEAKEEEEEKKS